LDAKVTDMQIFSFNINQNLSDAIDGQSDKANEYIKRSRAYDALRYHYYDNPKFLSELKLISKYSLKSNKNQYFRRIWRLLNNH
jgi:hypothetical protein